MSGPETLPPNKPKCAQCSKHPVNPDYRPFCSKRCADVDLHAWLNNGYAIPGSPADIADEVPDSADGKDD
jgi:endogenous inhibitor of DNA gyrase (YacG/DUF329 family)